MENAALKKGQLRESTFEGNRLMLKRNPTSFQEPVRPRDGARPLTIIRFLELLLDPLLVVLTLKISSLLYGTELDAKYIVLMALSFLTVHIVFKEINPCRSWRHGGIRAQTRDVIIAWLIVIGILGAIAYATKTQQYFSRVTISTWIFATPAMLLLGHLAMRRMLVKLAETSRFSRSVVIVGINSLSQRLVNEIEKDCGLSMAFAGFFDDRKTARVGGVDESKILGSFESISSYVKDNAIDVIYIALPMAQQERILKLLDGLHDTTASIYFTPDLFMFDLIQGRLDDVNGIPVVAVCETPFYGVSGVLKRLSDVALASAILLVISPLLVLIGLLVKVSSPGPVLFKQRRYGLDGEKIIVYKFRSMVVCEDGDNIRQVTKNDKRVTSVGYWLRRYSLDELPQFINVLQGRMSIVGPRPHAVAHNEMYRKLIKGYMVRHMVKPGITGWAQVNGFRGETISIEKMKDRIDHDLDYLRNWSVWLDIKIIFKTIVLLANDNNAY